MNEQHSDVTALSLHPGVGPTGLGKVRICHIVRVFWDIVRVFWDSVRVFVHQQDALAFCNRRWD
jgi:hypothetical protein